MAAVRTLTRASALVLTRRARASPSPSCAASRSHAVRARVHKLPRVSVGSPRGKSAAPSAALASGSHRVCAVPLALLAHPFALGVLPSHRHPLAAAARQRRAVGRGQPRAGVQAGAQGADGAARRGLAAGHGAAHQQREARPHAVEKITSRHAAEDTGYIPPPGLYMHTYIPAQMAAQPAAALRHVPAWARLCSHVGIYVYARVCGVAWQARERASVTCLARRATAQPDSPDRRPHRPPWPR